MKHAAEHVSHSALIDIFSTALIFFIWSFLPSDITAIVSQVVVDRFLELAFDMPYSRFLEMEADYVGLKLLVNMIK
jgi:hypothetical protein